MDKKKNTGQSQKAGYVLTILLASLPLIYNTNGVDPNLLPRQLAVSAYIILASCVLFFNKRGTGPSINLLFPFLFIGLAICYWLSLNNAINVVEARYTALKITTYVSAFLVSYFLFRSGIITIKHVAAGFTISLAITIALVLRDVFILNKLGIGLFESDNVYKINATFGHKNLLSAYLLFTLPFAAIQWKISNRKWLKLLVILIMVAALALIVVLQTRAVLLALVAGTTATSIVSMLAYSNKKGSKLIPLIILLVVLLFASGLYILRGKFSVITRTESFKERAALWENSWHMLKEYPMGVGAGNWQIMLPKYGIQKFYEFNYRVSEGLTTFQRPHNDFLWVACETGVIGGVIFCALFILLLFYLYRKIKDPEHEESRFINQVLFGLVVAYAMVSLVDFPLERMEHSFLFALVAAYISSSPGNKKWNLPFNKWLFLVPVLLSVFIIYVARQRWHSETCLKKMYRAHAGGNWPQLISYGEKANTDYMNMDYFSLPISWYIGVAYFASGNVAAAKAHFLQAYQINPYQVHVLNNLGVCYEKEKNYEKALPLLEQAHAISPTFSDGISTLAGAYYNTQRYDDAWRVISKFKYDDSNWQFKLFATAIIKAKLEQWLTVEKDEVKKRRIRSLLSDDKLLMNAYKESQQVNKEYYRYLLGF
ncbi:MAG: O-antigen ligase family protein [Bacteroidota bacterium]